MHTYPSRRGTRCRKKNALTRFKYCNRVQSGNPCFFCDTVDKLSTYQEKEYTNEELNELLQIAGRSLMITGGEPTFEPNFDSTIELLKLPFLLCNIETNGYRLKDLVEELYKMGSEKILKTKVIYSPKIFSSEDLDQCIQKIVEIYNFCTKQFLYYINIPKIFFVYVKFVTYDHKITQSFCEEIKKLNLPTQTVWLMSEGTNREDLIRNSENTLKFCNQFGFNYSSRNHIVFGFS